MANLERTENPLRIVVGVTGGVAAYKAAELVRLLQRRDADVQVVMTRAAEEFVRPLTFSSLTGRKVITSLWNEADAHAASPSGLDDEGQIEHIAVAQSADAIVIAPATANVLAKMAHGIADDFLSTMLLAATCPVVVAPAMNVNMWNHPATRANVATLRERGVIFVEPDNGYLACGMTGAGRLAVVESIADAVLASVKGLTREPSRRNSGPRAEDALRISSGLQAAEQGASTDRGFSPGHSAADLTGETILITAGGTREAIDPVRFLGNRSSGKMGYALAQAAQQRGAQVILVSAPTALAPPAGCAFVPVVSANEMHLAVIEHLPAATVVIGAAAVADFRVAEVATTKLRREGSLHLELEPTEDILRDAAKHRREGALVIAFAAETELNVQQAREKMTLKGADAIVLNDISQPGLGFDSDDNAAIFLTADDATEFPAMPKQELAGRILDRVLTLRHAPTKEELSPA